MGSVDLTPDPAASAARSTVRTAADWDAWAGRARTALDSLATTTHDSRMREAFSSYLERHRGLIEALPARVREQGTDLGTAVQTAVEGDAQARDHLAAASAPVEQQGPVLNRPISAE